MFILVLCRSSVILVGTSLFRYSVSIQGGGTLIRVTSYVSTDEDIHEAENIYSALEEALNRQINNMESTHMAYQSATMIGDQRLIRIDYEKYILN